MDSKRPPRKSQLQAYIAVLRALSSMKLDWSKQKLMVDLRKQLKISVEQHVKALDRVLKDPEVSAIREGMPLPPRGGGAPAAGPKRERPASPQHGGQHAASSRPAVQQEDRRATKGSRRSNQASGGRGSRGGRGGRGRPGRGAARGSGRTPAASASTPSLAVPRQSTQQANGDVHQYVGKRVTVFSKDSTPQWLEAVITDYRKETQDHCVTYDFNTGHESWHYLNVDQEIKRGAMQWVAGPPVDLQTVIPMVNEGANAESGKTRAPFTRSTGCGLNIAEMSIPFETAVLEECLESATLDELEQMRDAAVKRQKIAIGELIEMGDAGLEGAEPLVKVLVECEKLARRENALKEQVRRLESERQEMRQNNDVLGSRHMDAGKN